VIVEKEAPVQTHSATTDPEVKAAYEEPTQAILPKEEPIVNQTPESKIEPAQEVEREKVEEEPKPNNEGHKEKHKNKHGEEREHRSKKKGCCLIM